ncbi:GIY-YIG nuclease family protein [Lelliottia nimipressuralis]|uniref:GIY-YIG nuclease family protein n=1 Tax=Lelliottia nimipressuralis TaxID=69220 RepID=UPI001E5B7B9C|nr:GIY-YIG nuclease family protein [Lelliottia nimipressuralis]MCD4559465.1 GIY-YIG nuclease family protein [Lelliottia nimipressuralis]
MLWFVHLNILNLQTVCWFLYLVRTANNALYTGITTDVARRFLEHQTGKGAKALRGKGELTLAFSAHVGERSLALKMEYRIKQLTKRQKERLVAGDSSFEALRESLQNASIKDD